MKTDELLEKYQAIELAIIKINDDKSDLDKLTSSAKKAFDKQIADIKKLASSKEKELDALQKQLDSFTDSYSQKVNELSDLLDSIQETADEINQSLPDINELIQDVQESNKKVLSRMSAIEKQLKSIQAGAISAPNSPEGSSKASAKKPKITIDYNEEATAAELLEKYDGYIDTPVVIRLANWKNDYCMVVKSVENGYVSGDTYHQGVYVKSERRRDANTMKMYRTKYMAEIMADQAERYEE